MLVGNIDEEFMQKAIYKRVQDEGIKIGEVIGEEKGQKDKETELILSMFKNGIDISEISDIVNRDESYVKNIIENNR